MKMSDKQLENFKAHSRIGAARVIHVPSQLQTVMAGYEGEVTTVKVYTATGGGTDSGGLLGEFSGQSRKKPNKKLKKD